MKGFPGNIMGRFKGAEYVAIGIVALVVGLLTYKFIFATAASKIKGLKGAISVQEGQLRRFRELDLRKETILKEYVKIKPYAFSSPSEQDTITRVLKEIEKITQDSGVTVVSLLPSREFTQEKEYRKFRLELQVEGDIRQILSFLNTVQESRFLLMVDAFALSLKGEGSRILRFESTISFLHYAALR